MGRKISQSDDINTGFSNLMIIFHRTTTDADGANQHTVLINNRHTAGKSNQTLVGMLDTVKRPSGLR